MTDLIIKKETMTSLEIAEVTGRNHKDVMRSIREMEDAWAKVNGRKFALVEYKDAKGEMRPCYSLNKTECLYIATKFNDEARAKLVLRWEELETKERNQYQVPQSFAEALMLAAKQQELAAFAEAQGLDVKAENVASAIAELNYAALIAEGYRADKDGELRLSHESPVMKMLYDEYFEAPSKAKAHSLLHTHYTPRDKS